jgi:dTDP-4-amino-4,6-dideoxygalactose transaminase
MTTLTDDRPAVLGGRAAIDLPQAEALRWPLITGEDDAAVLDVLRSGELSIHPVVKELEDDYRRWLGVTHAVAHCNGTSAILAALHAFGIGPGDEVIVPSATWWASAMPALHCGGVPVFAETEDACLGLDPADVERRITPRTKAMVVVHLFGMPSRMDDLLAVARRHKLLVLEDASHAHGATYRGRPVGTLADAAVFSMQVNKLCPSSEGGMFLTNRDDLHERVLRLGHYERLLPLTQSPNRRFAATGFGYKFRMSPLSAAVARVQLRHLAARNATRNANCIYLSRRLERLGFSTFLAPPEVQRVYFEFLVRYDEERGGVPLPVLVKALQAEGATVGAPRYPLLHQQPVFTEGTWAELARIEPQRTYDRDDLPATTAGNRTLLRLPTFPRAERGLLDQYALAFEKVMAHGPELARVLS